MENVILLEKTPTADRPDGRAEAQLIASLKAEQARIVEQHRMEIRQLEISSYRAEFQLASELRQARAQLAGLGASPPAPLETVPAAMDDVFFSGSVRPVVRRSRMRRLLFRRDGRPRKWLRRLLFSPHGRPRTLTRGIVLDANGSPRRPFLQWMLSSAYRSLPDARAV